jgi:hypothetical protein
MISSAREGEIFSYWLSHRMIRKGVTAMAFMRLCDAGRVPGFAPDDWPESDTVSGDAFYVGSSKRREDYSHNTIPGNVTARPGPSTMRDMG